jgi:hypothetical protein
MESGCAGAMPSGDRRVQGFASLPHLSSFARSIGVWWFTVVLMLIALCGIVGCGATSDYMMDVAHPRPIVATPNMATVVFIRPSSYARSMKTTILDGRGTFLGDSLPKSHFAVLLPPGPHVFIAWAENTAALQATLLPGRVYFVEVAAKMGVLSARMHVLALTPRSENWAKVPEWLNETTQLVPDPAGGQAYLSSRPEDVQERIRRANEALSKYDAEELAERTLRPEDGR